MKIIKTSIIILTLGAFSLTITNCSNQSKSDNQNQETVSEQGPEYTSAYICPMHCEGSGSDKPGNCPACGMVYEKNMDHEMHSGDHENDNHEDHSGHSH